MVRYEAQLGKLVSSSRLMMKVGHKNNAAPPVNGAARPCPPVQAGVYRGDGLNLG